MTRRLLKRVKKDTNNTRINKTTLIRKLKWKEKQLHRYFKRLTNEISHEKIWTGQRKGNLMKETEYAHRKKRHKENR